MSNISITRLLRNPFASPYLFLFGLLAAQAADDATIGSKIRSEVDSRKRIR
jgi:hypothetical protein